MEKYLEALDKYIDFKINYPNPDLRQAGELRRLRADMEVQLLILIRRN